MFATTGEILSVSRQWSSGGMIPRPLKSAIHFAAILPPVFDSRECPVRPTHSQAARPTNAFRRDNSVHAAVQMDTWFLGF